MATRDLTTQYMRLRSAYHKRRPEAEFGTGGGLIDGAGGGAAHVDTGALTLTASPVYVDLVTDINGDINALQTKMADLRAAHEARVRITFDPTAEEQKDQEIQILTAEITRHFNLGGAKLKRLSNFDAGSEDAEIKLRKNIQRGLATRLHDLSTEFRKDQKQFVGTITKMRKGQSLQELFGGGGGKADVDEGFSDEQMHELATAEEDTDERMREIQRIAKSVEDLAVLFKELATLVVEQGTILDRIDYNMEQTVEATKKGVEELQVAEKYQKSARPVKCMIVLMVLIVIMVAIIICLCCYLRPGIVSLALLSFVNACFCFAGEGALLLGSGLASGIAESAGSMLPPGTVSASTAVHGGLIFAGVYMLLMAIFGFTAGFGKKPWAATAFYVMTLIDVVMGIAIAVILSFMVGFTALVTQVPVFFVNVYIVLVASSYRLDLLDATAGAGGSDAAHASRPKDPEVRSNRGGDFGVTAADVQVESGARVPQVAIDDEEDGDISRGGGQRV